LKKEHNGRIKPTAPPCPTALPEPCNPISTHCGAVLRRQVRETPLAVQETAGSSDAYAGSTASRVDGEEDIRRFSTMDFANDPFFLNLLSTLYGWNDYSDFSTALRVCEALGGKERPGW